MTIAFDIETCPLPLEALSSNQLKRYEKERARLMEREPGLSIEEAGRKVRSLHSWLGWICCISIARRLTLGGLIAASWCAPTPDAEEDMLGRFWEELEAHKGTQYVSFNGKRFDSPFIAVRSLVHAVRIPAHGRLLLNTHRWQSTPHCDLMHLMPVKVSFGELCELLRVETPKAGIDGSHVAALVESGNAAAFYRVRHYCEEDARATLECYEIIRHLSRAAL
jgi:3'-5' exonuclease